MNAGLDSGQTTVVLYDYVIITSCYNLQDVCSICV